MWLTICELNENAIKRATRIRAQALLEGITLPDMDLLIATTADPPVKLLTFDEDHERMKDLLKKEGINVFFLKRTKE